MDLIRLAYKVGQLFGTAACLTLGLGLMLGWLWEPNPWIRGFEIVGSFVAATILIADILDIHPRID